MTGQKGKEYGKVYVVGLGPGRLEIMTRQALEAVENSDVVIGYHVYIDLIEELLGTKKVISSGMLLEKERCAQALELAQAGHTVSLVSSGDPGIYGMAGPLLELNSRLKQPLEVQVIPGITAASMAAALLGAPLMHDTALISLSDALTPLEVIQNRLRCAAEADFVTVLYNPKSKARPDYVNMARDIFLACRSKETPVGIVRNAAREGQDKEVTTLEKLGEAEIDMFSVVVIGNSQTYCSAGMMITPRGYRL